MQGNERMRTNGNKLIVPTTEESELALEVLKGPAFRLSSIRPRQTSAQGPRRLIAGSGGSATSVQASWSRFLRNRFGERCRFPTLAQRSHNARDCRGSERLAPICGRPAGERRNSVSSSRRASPDSSFGVAGSISVRRPRFVTKRWTFWWPKLRNSSSIGVAGLCRGCRRREAGRGELLFALRIRGAGSRRRRAPGASNTQADVPAPVLHCYGVTHHPAEKTQLGEKAFAA